MEKYQDEPCSLAKKSDEFLDLVGDYGWDAFMVAEGSIWVDVLLGDYQFPPDRAAGYVPPEDNGFECNMFDLPLRNVLAALDLPAPGEKLNWARDMKAEKDKQLAKDMAGMDIDEDE